jgi:mono/diheme cytochrome c family protein
MPQRTLTTRASQTPSEREPMQSDTSDVSSSGATVEERDDADIERAAAEQVAYASAKPVFASYCAPCHTSDGSKFTPGARRHFSMDTYPFGGHHSAEIGHEIREVLGASGGKATMPKDKPGSVQGDELRLLLAWADAFDQAHPAPGATHDHQKGDEPD